MNKLQQLELERKALQAQIHQFCIQVVVPKAPTVAAIPTLRYLRLQRPL